MPEHCINYQYKENKNAHVLGGHLILNPIRVKLV
jgi:hypothetical protein